MGEAIWRIEAHIWLKNFDEYAEKERELHGILGGLHGNGSIIVFFRATPEYVEIPEASYDYMDDRQVGQLMDFCGRDNIDFVARVSHDTDRKLGCLRGKRK